MPLPAERADPRAAHILTRPPPQGWETSLTRGSSTAPRGKATHHLGWGIGNRVHVQGVVRASTGRPDPPAHRPPAPPDGAEDPRRGHGARRRLAAILPVREGRAQLRLEHALEHPRMAAAPEGGRGPGLRHPDPRGVQHAPLARRGDRPSPSRAGARAPRSTTTRPPGHLAAHAAHRAPLVLAFGPERGWSASERGTLEGRGLRPVAHLGERVLRTPRPRSSRALAIAQGADRLKKATLGWRDPRPSRFTQSPAGQALRPSPRQASQSPRRAPASPRRQRRGKLLEEDRRPPRRSPRRGGRQR